MFKQRLDRTHRKVAQAASSTCWPGLRSARSFLLRLETVVLAVIAVVTFAPETIFSATQDTIAVNGAGKAAGHSRTVDVTTERDGSATHFYVDNRELAEVTVTFAVSVQNLKSSVAFPYTATFPPQQRSEAFTLEPVCPGTKWEYSYTNYCKLGSHCARHDDDYVYNLPYSPGANYRVTQGFDGKFSHTGPNQYAVDWQMPEGTLVLAARGGQVIRVKDDSDRGGDKIEHDGYHNYVVVRHDDGTLGYYCHLKKGGALVKPGQKIGTGSDIARSGNTGFSSGPHLHFCVYRPIDGQQRISLPVRFKTAASPATTLVSGRSYRAPQSEPGSSKVSVAGVISPAGAID
ncbi:MAG TPA: M23 family metallopeptidase [Verrucomicrobiae bacterium]